MYEVILIDGTRHYITDTTLYEIFGERNYLKTSKGEFINRDHIMMTIYKI